MAILSKLHIIGTGSYLPERVVPNSEFEGREVYKYDSTGNRLDSTKVILTDDNIVALGGIRERRYASMDETPSVMGYHASLKALEAAGIQPNELEGILVATVTEDTNFPSAACKIQDMLGSKSVVAFDVAYACAGFPAGLAIANSLAAKRPGNYLVVASERLSSMVDQTDINCWLFGDGAGAAVLAPSMDDRGIVADYFNSDTSDGRCGLIFRDSGRMMRMHDGQKVMKQAVRSMSDSVEGIKAQTGWSCADVYVPHQANDRIIEALKARVPSGSKVYKNIERYGNMSAATCAVGLDEALRGGVIHDGDQVIVTSFGAGLVTTAVGIQF